MQGGRPKLIINLPDSDHEWNSTIIRVSAPWEATEESDCGNVPRAWGTGVIT